MHAVSLTQYAGNVIVCIWITSLCSLNRSKTFL